jgi:hypothetical protein
VNSFLDLKIKYEGRDICSDAFEVTMECWKKQLEVRKDFFTLLKLTKDQKGSTQEPQMQYLKSFE